MFWELRFKKRFIAQHTIRKCIYSSKTHHCQRTSNGADISIFMCNVSQDGLSFSKISSKSTLRKLQRRAFRKFHLTQYFSQKWKPCTCSYNGVFATSHLVVFFMRLRTILLTKAKWRLHSHQPQCNITRKTIRGCPYAFSLSADFRKNKVIFTEFYRFTRWIC